MQLTRILALSALLAGLAVTAGAQEAPQEKKPGGVNKVARDVSKTFKKAGRDTKAEAKRASSSSHQALTKAGNDTKAELKRTTGITSKPPSETHKPGGLNKMARDVSHASKKAGAKAKHGVKDAGSHTHHELTKTGKEAKEAAKKP